MNFSEFKKRLGAEPRSTDPELLAARDSSEEHAAAATAAAEFEARLESALNVQSSDTLSSDIMELVSNDRGPRGVPMWLSMAASVLIVVGVAGVVWNQTQTPESLENYVRSHFEHDGELLLTSAESAGDMQAKAEVIMAGLGASVDPEMGARIRYIKYCPTMNGRGAHMILASEHGPVTVIYMPDTQVDQSVLLEWDGHTAEVIALKAGSAAIIRDGGAAPREVQTLLRNSIHTDRGVSATGVDT